MSTRGRKGYGEELRIKESLAEITPLMFSFVKEVMETGTKAEKLSIVTKLLPKIVDKGMPSEMEHSGDVSFTIRWDDHNDPVQSEGVSEQPAPEHGAV